MSDGFGWIPKTRKTQEEIDKLKKDLSTPYAQLSELSPIQGAGLLGEALAYPVDWWGKFAASRLAYPFTKDIETPTPEIPEAGWIPRQDIPSRQYETWQTPWGVKGALELGAELPIWSVIPMGGLKSFKALGKAAKEAPTIGEKIVARAGQVAVSPLAGAEKALQVVSKPITETLSKALVKRFPQLPERVTPVTPKVAGLPGAFIKATEDDILRMENQLARQREVVERVRNAFEQTVPAEAKLKVPRTGTEALETLVDIDKITPSMVEATQTLRNELRTWADLNDGIVGLKKFLAEAKAYKVPVAPAKVIGKEPIKIAQKVTPAPEVTKLDAQYLVDSLKKLEKGETLSEQELLKIRRIDPKVERYIRQAGRGVADREAVMSALEDVMTSTDYDTYRGFLYGGTEEGRLVAEKMAYNKLTKAGWLFDIKSGEWFTPKNTRTKGNKLIADSRSYEANIDALRSDAEDLLDQVALPKAEVGQLPERTLTNTYEQKVQAHKLAYKLNLLTKKAQKPTPLYRKIAKIYTGKDSMKDMTRDEADNFIEALSAMKPRGTKPPKISSTTAMIPALLIEKIPLLHEIGAKERFRQIPQVLKKIGLYNEFWNDMLTREVSLVEERNVFRQNVSKFVKQVGNNPERKARIFDALENPLESHLLDPEEQQVFLWFRKFYDAWADRLGLAKTQRRQNYVTHIFEEAITQDIKAKHPLDPEIIKAMEFRAPKKIFNPFLQQRIGANVGLKRDPFAAADAYEQYALRQYYYQPLVKKLTAYEPLVTEYAGENAGRHFRMLANRLAGRPDVFDKEINYSIKEFVGKIGKIPVINKFGGAKLAALSQVQHGNIGALVVHNYVSIMYQSFLGLRPKAAIRNLTQTFLTAADVGLSDYARGLKMQFTSEGKAALKKSLVMRSRQIGFLPGVETSTLSQVTKKAQDIALALFKISDKVNVSNAFISGYTKGRRLGLPVEWAIKLGDEVATDTQFLYTRMANSIFEQTTTGKFLTPFTSWPRNFTELMGKWIEGRGYTTIQEYEKLTGKTIVKESHNALLKRKQLLTYMAMVTSAYAVEKTTNLKANEYTGWTSIRNLGQLVGGEVPSLQLIGGLAQLVTGAFTGDTTQMKKGWYEIRPDRFVGIIRELENLAQGKADWVDLFLYMEKAKSDSADEKLRGLGK